MCNRIHFASSKSGESVATLLTSRGYKVSVLRSGCVYIGGVILELGDNAFDFAIQIADAFHLGCKVEF